MVENDTQYRFAKKEHNNAPWLALGVCVLFIKNEVIHCP